MKIQCNACEAAEATVLCCADEAALCAACDEKVHAANKLAGKHQRVPLASSSSHMPKCDICQETVGYFFCLEDRALLCRRCDVSIHTSNQYVAAHQRFLLTGVKVGLEPTESSITPPKEKNCQTNAKISTEGAVETQLRSVCKNGASMSTSSDNVEVLPSQNNFSGCLPATMASFTGGTSLAGMMPEWPMEDLLGLAEHIQNYGFMDQGSSKADHCKTSDSDWSPFYRETADTGFDLDECFSHAAEMAWTVPEVPSPPTASGLHWPKDIYHVQADHSVHVPDICDVSPPVLSRGKTTSSISKRRKRA